MLRNNGIQEHAEKNIGEKNDSDTFCAKIFV